FTQLQGIWEQISLRDDKGKREDVQNRSFEFQKNVRIFVGKKCYTIHSNGLGGGVTLADGKIIRDAKLNRLELVNPNDNQTTRCLFETTDGLLTICVGKTLKWPTKIAPTSDGDQVHVYRKLPPAKNVANDKEDSKKLAGIWETIEFQRDGRTFSKDSKDDD